MLADDSEELSDPFSGRRLLAAQAEFVTVTSKVAAALENDFPGHEATERTGDMQPLLGLAHGCLGLCVGAHRLTCRAARGGVIEHGTA